MNLTDLQFEVGQWHREMFPGCPNWQLVLKAVEEVGELARAENRLQGTVGADARVWEHKRWDAIGDIVIVLAALCDRLGFDLEQVTDNVWAEVKARPVSRVRGGSGN